MKIITRYIVVAAMMFGATSVDAQNEWKSSSPIGISYGSQTLKEDVTGIEYKSSFSIGILKRHTYNLHKYPIGDVLMFGLDLNWFEMNVARFEKGKGLSLGNMMNSVAGNVTSGNYSTFDDYFNDAYQSAPSENDEDEDFNGALNRLNVGKYQLNAHLIGIGPSVKWAPFGAGMNSTLEKIKLTAYFHYLPTLTALVFTGEGDDENTFCGGYMSCWRGGASLQFGRFGVGVEHYWGSGNLKKWKIGDDDEQDDGLNVTSEKRKYLMSGLRFYVGLKF